MLQDKRWLLVILSLVLVSALSLAGCSSPTEAPKPGGTAIPSPAAAQVPKAISIGTMPKGSQTNVVGAGLAKVISDYASIAAVDSPFGGYLNFVPLVNKGELDLGLVTAPETYYAYTATEPYKDKNTNLRLISGGTLLNVGFACRANAGIKTMADVKGKKFGQDTSSLSTKVQDETVLRANGIDPDKDVTKIPVAGVVEAQNALAEGRIDFCNTSIGHPKVTETAAKVGGVYWIPFAQAADDAAAKKIKEALPGRDVVFIKAGTKPDVNNDTWVLGLPLTLVTYNNFSEEAAYRIAKALYQHEEQLGAIHPQLKGWTKAMVYKGAVLPYHAGAIRFYKEAGAWNDEMDQVQKKLLSQ